MTLRTVHNSRLIDGAKIDNLPDDTNDELASNEANIETHKLRVDNPHSVTKAQVGLGDVDNTSDTNKPISIAQAAINTSIDGEISALQADSRTLEQLQDAIAAMFQGGTHTNISVVYDDATGVINLTGGAGGGATLTQEEVEDFVGGLMTEGTGINITYNDAGNVLTVELSGESFTTALKNKLDSLNASAQIPAGGTAGQVLEKIDGIDYNTQWATPSSGGGGGKFIDGTDPLDAVYMDGNVGIGTTSPETGLHLSTSGSNIATFQTSATGDGAIEIRNTQGSVFYGIDGGENFGIGNGPDLNGVNAMLTVQMSTGNVGIGTTSPGEKLHVVGNQIVDGAFYLDNSTFVDPTTATLNRSIFNMWTESSGQFKRNLDISVRGAQGGGVGGSQIRFWTNSASSNIPVERMVISRDGNVGIGTTSPASIGHLYQNSADTGEGTGLTIEQDGVGDAIVQYVITGARRWVNGIDNSDADKFKWSASADLNVSSQMTLTTDGKLGIGITKTSPTQELDVGGTITCTRMLLPVGTNLY